MIADVVGEEVGVVVVAVGKTSRQVLYHRQHEGTEDEPILIIIRTVGDEVDGEHDEGEEEPCDDDNLADVEARHVEALRIVAVEALLVATDLPLTQKEEDSSHDEHQ